MYGALGGEFQVAVGLPAPEPSVVDIALSRADNDFTDEELKLLDVGASDRWIQAKLGLCR